MKFIFNFIFFGLLFYLIWWNFPEQFKVLQSWAASVIDMLIQFYHVVVQRLDLAGAHVPPVPPTPPTP